jgi:uncharacterized protein YqhQ
MRDGRRGRIIARLELALAGVLALVVGPFLFVAAPGTVAGLFTSTLWLPAELLGVAGGLIGFVWIVHLFRAGTDPDQQARRYRR